MSDSIRAVAPPGDDGHAIGTAVLVGGQVVAWFADFDDYAEDWCTQNHFGQWLTWRATPPEIIPLTPQEEAECQRRAAELSGAFKESPKADAGETHGATAETTDAPKTFKNRSEDAPPSEP